MRGHEFVNATCIVGRTALACPVFTTRGYEMELRVEHSTDVPPGPPLAANIQQAIDRVYDAGGGRVTISPGTYEISTIFLRDGIELHLEYGAVLQAWHNLEDYTPIEPAADNKDQSTVHLVVGIDCTDIAITGRGIIDGQDKTFWEPIEEPEDRMYGIFRYNINGGPRSRPSPLVQLIRCKNVRVEDITIRAAECLRAADVIACEDTRHSARLLSHLEISGKELVALHATNQAYFGPAASPLALAPNLAARACRRVVRLQHGR